MAKRPLPTPELLRQLLSYDPRAGSLTWLPRDADALAEFGVAATHASCQQWNGRYAGRPALTGIDGFGYFHGTVFGHYLKAHRVAWVLAHGQWPDGVIDHINGNGRDNRLINLRNVSHAENLRNCRKSKRNTSGVTGVFFNKKTGRWVASIMFNRKVFALGAFDSLGDAQAARESAEKSLGFSDGHGSDREWRSAYVPKANRV